ncbi:MAG TPA: DUF393 domain-containing protein [bacterium]|nr:DUF393 domain-containing protein [bacterium]
MLKHLGKKLYEKEMIVAYDGNCRLCCRTIATLKFFDVFGRIRYMNALNQETLKQPELSSYDPNELLQHMHAVCDGKSWKGYYAYRAIAWRIPLLWPILPFLYLWPITAIGRRIYQHVAGSRTCKIKKPTPPAG